MWTCGLPVKELYANLPAGCRRSYDPDYRNWGPVILGVLAGVGLTWLVLAPSVGSLVGSWQVAALAALILGGPPGLLAGLLAAWMLTPAPFWLVRRKRIENPSESETRREGSEDLGFSITPLLHTYLLGNVEENMSSKNPQPGVYLATSWSRKVEATAIRRFFTSKMSLGQKLQVASLGVMAVCMAGVVMFLLLATRE